MKLLRAADLFCGAGGSSTGLARACATASRRLDLTAVNHNETAIATHSANYPAARHLCHDLDNVNPREVFAGQRLDLLIASPECTQHSNARGGKPMNDQSRSTAWHVVRWADALQPKFILVENVREFMQWSPLGTNGRPLKKRKGETFQAWVQAIRSLGYTVDWRLLNAADYGAATSRTRLFVMARRGNGPLPWPEPTHAREAVADLYGNRAKWRAAREVIDWSIPCPSIFTRKRPLSANTLKRIEAGLRRFGGSAAEPFLVLLNGGGRQGSGGVASVGDPVPVVTAGGGHIALAQPFILDQHSSHGPRSADDPAPTITTTSRGIGVVQPFVLGLTHGGRERSADDPLPTVTAAHRGELGVVQPFVLGQQSGAVARDTDEPLPTVATGGAISLVQPFLIPANYGERPRQAPRSHSIDDPVPTVVGTASHAVVRPFMVQYNRGALPGDVEDPLRTATATDRFGLAVPDVASFDIGFRMLQPHELAAAMGFPADYHFAGNRGERVKQVGNAVEVNMAQALCLAIVEVIGRAG